MKHRIVSVLTAVMLCLLLTAPSLAAEGGYTDVPDHHWSTQSILRATQLGIFQGVSEHTFGFGQTISRAAFAQALVRLFSWETTTAQASTFEDVASDAWYYDAVETAVAHGAIPVSGKHFRPTQPLTRSDMVSMLMRALGYGSLASTVSNYETPFADVTANKGFITMAYDMGIVTGISHDAFAPNENATRDQAAALLVRVYDRLMTPSYETVAGDLPTITIQTPAATQSAELPTTPLEPIRELYAALRSCKRSGQDMSRTLLCLTAGGVCTLTGEQGELLSSESVTAEQVAEILAQDDVHTYYSERYESAYCVYAPNEYQTATVWYQSEASLAVKLQLARMFGITGYILQ